MTTPSRWCLRCHGTDPHCRDCTRTALCFDGKHHLCKGEVLAGNPSQLEACTCACHPPPPTPEDLLAAMLDMITWTN